MQRVLHKRLAQKKKCFIAFLADRLQKKREGSLLVEALIAILIFGLFATASFLTLLTGQESSQMGSDRVRGVFYTQQLLEVAIALRDDVFSNLTAGTHGYDLDEDGNWVLSGSSLNRYNVNTKMTITDLPNGYKAIDSRSSWKMGYFRSGATVLSLILTDWRDTGAAGIGDWENPILTGSLEWDSFSGQFSDIEVDNGYAYVSANAAGSGLHVFDVSDPTSPIEAYNTLLFTGQVNDPIVYNDTLFVAVEDGTAEIKAYDVSINPGSQLNESATPLATYDLPGGGGRAKSMFQTSGKLFVGAVGDVSESEFYIFDISASGSISLLGELDISGQPTVYDVYVSGNYAYLATTHDTKEMLVVNVSNTSSPSEHSAHEANDVHDGYAVRQYGTGYYLGRAYGLSVDEYEMITGSGGMPSDNLSNKHSVDLGGGVNAMDLDPLGCYAYFATGFGTKELQIRSARYKDLREEAYVDLTYDAYDVHYDVLTDLLYVTTNTGVLIFDTASPTGDCS